MTRQTENISFQRDGRTYTAYGWWDADQHRYVVNSVLVHFEQAVRSMPSFKRSRTRWVFRGIGGTTKLQRQLVLVASSLLYDRRLAQIAEAA